MVRSLFTPASRTQEQLALAAAEPRYKPAFLSTLLSSKVYVTDVEMVLGDDGPYVEFRPLDVRGWLLLSVYTARARVPRQLHPMAAQSMPFAYVLHTIDRDTTVVVDPFHEAYRLEPEDLALLRRVHPPREL